MNDLEPLLSLYKTMVLIRSVETTLGNAFARGEIPGFLHLSTGQEAVAAGVAASMGPKDTLATNHRGHGHVLARGLDLEGFLQEVLGRANGICGGRGGSMHVSDMHKGIIGANGIVAAGVPIALGSALALQRLNTRGVAVAMFGDGALAEGVLYESMNMAALLKLPLLFTCENNGWGEFSKTEDQFCAKLADLAAAFGIWHVAVDGNDALAVFGAATAALDRLRRGEGPGVLECHTTRLRGHFEGDAQKYRTSEEVLRNTQRDPIARAASSLRSRAVTDDELTEISAAAAKRVAAALERAQAAPFASFEDAFSDVYSAGT
jgi:pyruvate dehydrogenase E1 component alpha subunit